MNLFVQVLCEAIFAEAGVKLVVGIRDDLLSLECCGWLDNVQFSNVVDKSAK